MNTSLYLKTTNFRCDCCDERVTQKGGRSPFYLCETHAKLAVQEVAKLRAAKHGCSNGWIEEAIEHERIMTEEHGPAEYNTNGQTVGRRTKRRAAV